MLKVYFCPCCLELGYRTMTWKYHDFSGEEVTGGVRGVYCPGCGNEVVVAEVSDDLEREIKDIHTRTDVEALASALLLLIAAGKIKAKRWIVEDGCETFVEFKPTMESILNYYGRDTVLKGYSALSNKLRAHVLPELI